MTTLFPAEATSDLLARATRHLMPSYRPAPIVLVRGEGVRVFDRDGRGYLDMVGGIAVNSLGHAHPRLCAVIAEQARALVHVSNLYFNEPSIALADELCRLSGLDRVFFSNSGAEANEAALKAARRYQTSIAGRPDKTLVLAFKDSFHGRTFGALSVTGQPKYHQGFEPLVPGAVFARFSDLDSVDEALAAGGGRVGAIIVEPIQCEGGINMPAPGFLEGLRARADRDDIVLIFDEVQTGVGRTGTWWCFEHHGLRPDVLTTAKGIAGGVPLGAMMASERIAQALQPGTHASTFGANPLATRAGLEVLRTIAEEGCSSAPRASASGCTRAARAHRQVVRRRHRGARARPGARARARVGRAREQGRGARQGARPAAQRGAGQDAALRAGADRDRGRHRRGPRAHRGESGRALRAVIMIE